jgi:hypothetical protein
VGLHHHGIWPAVWLSSARARVLAADDLPKDFFGLVVAYCGGGWGWIPSGGSGWCCGCGILNCGRDGGGGGYWGCGI